MSPTYVLEGTTANLPPDMKAILLPYNDLLSLFESLWQFGWECSQMKAKTGLSLVLPAVEEIDHSAGTRHQEKK